MRARKRADPPDSDRTFKAAGLFARLADSLDRGDLAEAADAQKELARLGFAVRPGSGLRPEVRLPRLKPPHPHDKADGREGRHGA